MRMLQQVWVAYATADQQFHISVPFSEGMTAQDAIQLSGIGSQVELPEPLQLGIFGVRLKDLQQVLQAGDRVEIYRTLSINPKDDSFSCANPSLNQLKENSNSFSWFFWQ